MQLDIKVWGVGSYEYERPVETEKEFELRISFRCSQQNVKIIFKINIFKRKPGSQKLDHKCV